MFESSRKLRVAALGVVAAGALLAAGCGTSSPGTSGRGTSGPGSSGPGSTFASVKGAVATLPDITGQGADCIFPMETTACYSAPNYQDFEYLMVRPLYMFGNNGQSIAANYSLSPADAPIYSDGDKTITINMKGWKWSDGTTVDAADLIFFLNMLEGNKANYAGYTPGLAPDNIASYSATGPEQVTLHLKQAYSSIWYTYNQLAILYPFPLAWDVTHVGAKAGSGGCETDSAADGWAKCKAVWAFLNKQNKDIQSYAGNPLWQVVDGPFRLTAYDPQGNYTFVPNPKYSGSPKPSISELKFVDVTSDTAEYTGLRTGVYSQGDIPSTDLPPAVGGTFRPATNPLTSTPDGGYSLEPGYAFVIGYSLINYNNPVYGPVFKQLYFRQALAMLDNQKGMDAAVGRGYSVSTDSGVPSEPASQWISPVMRENGGQGPYPYSPSKAEAMLAAHGWQVVGGVLTCEKPGSGASDCGAGIPKGLQAKFSMLYTSGVSTMQDDVDILKSGFGQAGIRLAPIGLTFDTLLGDTTACHGSRCTWTFLYLSGWAFNGPGFEPTGEALFQTGAPNNTGGYSDPQMNRLIARTHTSNSLAAFYAYADYSAKQEPSLWMPWPVSTVAVSMGLHNDAQNPLGMLFPEYWSCSAKDC